MLNTLKGTGVMLTEPHFNKKNFQPRGDGTFIELSERFFNITLSEYKDIENYTKALKKVRNQLSSLHVKIPEPLVIQRYLKGLGSAYNTFHTSGLGGTSCPAIGRGTIKI